MNKPQVPGRERQRAHAIRTRIRRGRATKPDLEWLIRYEEAHPSARSGTHDARRVLRELELRGTQVPAPAPNERPVIVETLPPSPAPIVAPPEPVAANDNAAGNDNGQPQAAPPPGDQVQADEPPPITGPTPAPVDVGAGEGGFRLDPSIVGSFVGDLLWRFPEWSELVPMDAPTGQAVRPLVEGAWSQLAVKYLPQIQGGIEPEFVALAPVGVIVARRFLFKKPPAETSQAAPVPPPPPPADFAEPPPIPPMPPVEEETSEDAQAWA